MAEQAAASSSRIGESELLRRLVSDVGASDLTRMKAVVGVLTSVAFAYILGGVVLALRLDVAGFPVRDSLQVFPPQTLLFTGVRELVLSALVAAILLGVVVALSAVPAVGRYSVFVVTALLFVVVPLNAGGLAWPIALLLLGLVLYLLRRRYEHGADREPGAISVLAVALLAVTCVTLGRYMVPPNEFPIATVQLIPRDGERRASAVTGGYLASTGDYVYLAQRDRGDTRRTEAAVDALRSDAVASIRLRPRPDEPDPQPSLFALITGVDVAATPWLDLWVNNRQRGVELFH